MERNLRVRLRFEKCRRWGLDDVAPFQRTWFLVDIKRLRTIDDLAEEIQERFNVDGASSLQLYIDDCIVPGWESTAILRENDLISIFGVPKDSEIGKSIHGNDCNDDNSSEDKSVSKSEDNNHKKKRRKKDIEQKEEIVRFSVLQTEDKNDEQCTHNLNENTLNDANVNEDLKKHKRKQKRRKLNADDCDSFALRESLDQSGGNNRGHQSKTIDTSASEHPEVGTGCLSDETIHCYGDSLNHSIKLKPGNVVINEVPTKTVVLTEETGVGDVETEDSANKLHKEDAGIETCSIGNKKNRKRTRRSRKNQKTNQNNATISASTLLNDGPKKNDFVANNRSGKILVQSKINMSSKETVHLMRDSVSHSKHIIFNDDDRDDETTNLESENIKILSSCVQRSNSGCSKEEIGRECLTDSNRNSFSDPNANFNSLTSPVIGSAATEIQNHGATEFQDLPARLQNGPITDESSWQHNKLPVDRLSLSEDTAGLFSKPRDVNHFGSDPQLLNNASKHKAKRVSDANPFANVQIFRRRRQKNPASVESASAALDSFPLSTESHLRNKTVAPEIVVKDYSNYHLLLGPPRAGDYIAYKILELGIDYSPAVSSYKEALVLSYSHESRTVELKSLNPSSSNDVKKSLGRFDLTIEDENEILTNSTLSSHQIISLLWDLLIEPRLLQ